MERVIQENINTTDYWDGFATEGYLEADRKRGGNICRFSNILSIIEKDKDILDVGCLNGNLYNFIKEKEFPIKTFNGIDISEKLIELAATRFPEQDWNVGNCYELPFEDNTFDIVTSLEVIEHIEDPKKMLLELRRVIKPNGSLIITTPRDNFVKDLAHIWSFSMTDMFNLLSEVSKNIQIMKICSTDRYILAKAIIDYSNNFPI